MSAGGRGGFRELDEAAPIPNSRKRKRACQECGRNLNVKAMAGKFLKGRARVHHDLCQGCWVRIVRVNNKKGLQPMLVISRKNGEQIVIDGGITITVVSISGNRARIGVVAPKNIAVDSKEVYERKMANAIKDVVDEAEMSLEDEIAVKKFLGEFDRHEMHSDAAPVA